MDKVRNQEIINRIGAKSMQTKVSENTVSWYRLVIRMMSSRLTKKVWRIRMPKKMSRSRPRRRWNDEVGAYLKEKRLGWREAKTLVQDRKNRRRKLNEGNN